MELHESLYALGRSQGRELFNDADSFRGALDDYLDALTNEEWEERWRQKFAKAPAGRIDLVIEDAATVMVGFVSAGPNRWPLDGLIVPTFSSAFVALFVKVLPL